MTNTIHNTIIFIQELGDIENWSQVIEAEMTTIAGALEYAYKGEILMYVMPPTYFKYSQHKHLFMGCSLKKVTFRRTSIFAVASMFMSNSTFPLKCIVVQRSLCLLVLFICRMTQLYYSNLTKIFFGIIF